MKYSYSYYTELIKTQANAIVGIGVTAFNRVGVALAIPSAELICYDSSSDLEWIKKHGITIHSIEQDYKTDIPRYNSFQILSHPKVVEYLHGKKGTPYVVLYRSSPETDTFCSEQGFKVIGNPYTLREKFENKKEFRKVAQKLGLPVIPGMTVRTDALGDERFLEQLHQEIGEQLVMQFTEAAKGGGGSTVFVKSKADYPLLWEKIDQLTIRKNIKNCNVTKFIQGPATSMTGCVTKHGILHGRMQTQVIDQLLGFRDYEQDITDPKHGKFDGHDWSFRQYSDDIQTQGARIIKTLGQHMASLGYKGIFGVDMMVDSHDHVYVLECNPRYTGAFPVYTMLQLQNNEIPIDVFHALEFLDIPYDLDVDTLNAQWQTPKYGAQVVLHNRWKHWLSVSGNMPAGVYKYHNHELVWQREGFSISDIKNSDEVVYADGCPYQNTTIKPKKRLGRLLFPDKVLGVDLNLNPHTREIVDCLYKSLKLSAVEAPTWDEEKQQWLFV